jgi:hypothetical protein
MLTVICDPDYLESVRAFARRIGKHEQLQKQLDYLSTYGETDEYETLCQLGKDFAPHSFSFRVLRVKRGDLESTATFRFNGGLIYQGPDSPADGSFPSLTVSLAEGTGWFVHT